MTDQEDGAFISAEVYDGDIYVFNSKGEMFKRKKDGQLIPINAEELGKPKLTAIAETIRLTWFEEEEAIQKFIKEKNVFFMWVGHIEEGTFALDCLGKVYQYDKNNSEQPILEVTEYPEAIEQRRHSVKVDYDKIRNNVGINRDVASFAIDIYNQTETKDQIPTVAQFGEMCENRPKEQSKNPGENPAIKKVRLESKLNNDTLYKATHLYQIYTAIEFERINILCF